MPISLGIAQSLLSSVKALVISPGHDGDTKHWDSDNERHGSSPIIVFRCRVAQPEVMPRGLWFRITLWPKYPKTMTFQMDLEIPKLEGHLVLYRLEVDPDSVHANKKNCSGGATFFNVGETHEHSYIHDLGNVLETVDKKGSPCAVRIERDFVDFTEALTFVCGRLNIQNGGDLPKPVAQLKLNLR